MSNAAESLARVAQMADALMMRVADVEAAEKVLSDAKAALRTLEEEDFPALLIELELSSVKLADGRTIELKKDVRCGITQENKFAAHEWLRINGFGGLIKTELKLPFGKGQEDEMREAEEKIVEATGLHPERSEGVHPQTLKSFIKEQREAGAALPNELFGVQPYDRVAVKQPRR